MSSLLEKKLSFFADYFQPSYQKRQFYFQLLVSLGIVNWFLNYCQEIDKTQANRNFNLHSQEKFMSLSSKVAIFNAPKEPFQLQEVAVKTLEPREVLIKNEYVTLCRSDLLTYSGKRKEKTPTLLGHEIVGRIAAFSDSDPASVQ